MNSDWWLSALPAISGGLRATFYLGLLALCLVDFPSPLHAGQILSGTNRLFYTPARALQWIGVQWVEPTALRGIAVVTIVAWLAAACGLCIPLTAALTFLGFAFLHAVNWGALGSNHSTHAALYVLFFLCFSAAYDWSLDSALSSHGRWPLLLQKGSALESGFATRIVLVFLVYCMFAAGVAKIRYGGLGWLDGSALRFYISESAEDVRWPAFARLLVARPWLCRLLSWFTVVVELSSIVLLFNPALRLPMIVLWCFFHAGILLVMMPAYWVQMWCYVLLIDWGRVLGKPTPMYELRGTNGENVLTLVGTLFGMTLACVLVRQVESWPFTNVPMYSNTEDIGGPYPLEELQARARRVVRGDIAAWKRPWVTGEAWEDIWLRSGDAPPRSLFNILSTQPTAKWVRWSQFAKVVRRVAIEDVAAKPGCSIAFDERCKEYPATRFLRQLKDSIGGYLPGTDLGLDLVCHAKEGWIVLGRIEL